MDEDGAAPTSAVGADASSVIEEMAVGYVSLDRTWRITRVNAAAEGILGKTAGELLGRNLWEQFPGARELEFGRVYESVMTTRQPASFDAWYPVLSVWFELRVQPTPHGIACYFLDVTARKQAQSHEAQAAERARFVAGVADALAGSLDVFSNVVRLAQLVVPYLGTWSIVAVADRAGVFQDMSSWHADPARRRTVAQYMNARQAVPPGTIAEDAVSSRKPAALMTNAHSVLRVQMADEDVRASFDDLAPHAAVVVPMLARGRTVGLLSLFADAPWSDGQLEVAKDVASRAALSIDNSAAYERARFARAEAESARAEAERANKRLALLARVSEALTANADPDVAVGNLARLVVPDLADWSLVTVVDEDHALRDIGVAHRDPKRQPEVENYASRRSVAKNENAPLATVLRTGEPVVFANMSDDELAAAQTDPAVRALVRALEPHGVAYIPLTARGRVFGVLTLVTTHERGAHQPDEIEAALEIADRAGPVLDGARAAHRARRLAESVQRSVLATPPAGPGLEVRTRYRPAQLDHEVGGDWYDHFDLPEGSTVVTIGDVMGHDVAAIAAMAQLRTLMRAAAWTGRHSPADVLTATDSASRALGPGTFATALTGELERAGAAGSVAFRWSNAGHLAPAVLDRDGVVRFLTTDVIDVPLGVMPAASRRNHAATLEPGSMLLLYTDGLVERRDRDLDVGLARLADVMRATSDDDLDTVLDRLLSEMGADDPYSDDVALLAVRIGAVHR
ncbi:SpoIIE family protein phosphatase [uncultured Jatrophihabitans sp.]|uniref:SpoIIE family protein phosphatase n=1 Tax=uncultured Jatrophihabitans sp. TaxID=1610747 RepID=UPI0035CB439E